MVLFTWHKQVTLNTSEPFLQAKICFLAVRLVTDPSLSGQRAEGVTGKKAQRQVVF